VLPRSRAGFNGPTSKRREGEKDRRGEGRKGRTGEEFWLLGRMDAPDGQ